MSKEEVKEFADSKAEKKEGGKRASFRDLIDGSIITSKTISGQLPFFFFLAFIAALYIGNRYHAEKVYRDITRMQTEVKDMRAESITTASELMFLSKQSEVIRVVKEKGIDIEESVQPPYKIRKAGD